MMPDPGYQLSGSGMSCRCIRPQSNTYHGISQGLVEITKWVKIGLGYISSGLERPLTASSMPEDTVR